MRRFRLAKSPLSSRWLVFAAALIFASVVIWHFVLAPVSGAQLGDRALQVASNEISANTDYQLSFNISTAGTVGSVVAQFCSNDPYPNQPCTTPGGIDLSGANFVSQSGPGGFSLSSSSDDHTLILTRPPAGAGVGAASFHFDNVINPSSPGPYYVRVLTYATSDASGPFSDYGGIAFYITNAVAISAEVPPYLTFCTGVTISGLNCANANGNYIDFGELSSKKASHGSSQMLVATNAELGYNITASGTTLTSGNNVIPSLPGGDVSRPGVGQFGFNLSANTTPPGGTNPFGPGTSIPKPEYSQPNVYRFVNGETIVSHPTTDDVREYTSSYVVNVPASQAAGIYVTTVTYVCLANF